MSKGKRKRKKREHHVLSTVGPKAVAAIASKPLDAVAPEPHVVVAVPQSTWRKFVDWIQGV